LIGITNRTGAWAPAKQELRLLFLFIAYLYSVIEIPCPIKELKAKDLPADAVIVLEGACYLI
jgi:hypothetical protein